MLLICALALAVATGPLCTDAARVRDLLDRGHYVDAVPCARAVLDEAETAHGPHALETARALDLLLEALGRARGGDADQARALASRALAIKERLLGTGNPALADTLDVAAFALMEVRWVEARDLAERSLAIRVAALGEEHLETARSNYLLGRLHIHALAYRTAKPYIDSAWRIRQAALGGAHPETVRALQARGLIAADLADVPACEQQLAETLAATERDLGPDHPEVAEFLRGVAACRYAAHDLPGALEVLRRALEIDERAFGAEHPVTALGLAAIAGFQAGRMEFEEARPAFRRAIAMLTHADGQDDPRIGSVRLQYAWCLVLAGELDAAYDEATAAMDRVLEVFGDGPRVAGALHTLAVVHRDRGDYALAKAAFERALAIEVVHLDQYAGTLHELAMTLVRMKDDRAARPLLERALAMFRKVAGDDDPGEWPFDNVYAALLGRAGELAAAEEYFHRAIRGVEQLYGPEYGGLTYILPPLARVHAQQGRFATAEPLMERAIAIAEKSYGPENGRTRYSLSGMCQLRLAAGDPAAALPVCQRALAISEKGFGAHNPETIACMADLASALLATQDANGALQHALRAESEARAHFLRTAQLLSEREALGFGGARLSGRDVALSALAAMETSSALPVRSAWDEITRSRTLVLDEMAARQRSALDIDDPDARAAHERLDTARTRLSRALTRQASRPGEQARAAVDDAVGEVGAAERALAEYSTDFRRTRETTRVGLEDVETALPAHGALVAYVKYERLTRASPPARIASYLAFVLPGGGREPAVVFLGPAGPIDQLVAAWRREVTVRPPASEAGAREALREYATAATALRRAVWDPVRSHLDKPRLVFIVPDGGLHLVNFATFPAGDERYLVEDEAVLHVIAAEHELVDAGKVAASGRGILVLGGPDFDRAAAEASGGIGKAASAGGAASPRSAAADCAGRGGLGPFGPLPRSLLEIEEVGSICRSWFAEGDGVLRLTGANATEGAFKRGAPGRRIVHLATHGFVLDEACLMQSPPRSAAKPPPDALLQLAGLALAGANRHAEAKADEDDGVLTAEEIASVDLNGVDWAVLSACESGLGRVLAGEGVLGLRRAFRIAGARTLIASLWKVRDDDARRWMRRLYEARAAGQSTAAAVRSASTSILASRKSSGASPHPFYWGAFVASGAWN